MVCNASLQTDELSALTWRGNEFPLIGPLLRFRFLPISAVYAQRLNPEKHTIDMVEKLAHILAVEAADLLKRPKPVGGEETPSND